MNLAALLLPSLRAHLSKLSTGEKYQVIAFVNALTTALLDGDRIRAESLMRDMELTPALAALILSELLVSDESLISR